MPYSYSGQRAAIGALASNGAAEWTIRPYREGDLPAIADLINAESEAYRLDESVSAEELRTSYESPRSNPARQVVVAEARGLPGLPAGALLGAGRAFYEESPWSSLRTYYLWLAVHPAVEGAGLEREIARKLLDIVHGYESSGEMEPKEKISVKAYTREELAHLRALWRSLGMRQVRQFWTMARDLNEPIDDPAPVEGVEIRTYKHPVDDGAALDAFNDSFSDHWDYHGTPQDEWEHWIASPHTRLDLSWLAEVERAPGKIAGFCVCMIFPDDNKRRKVSEGWIDLLGTTRDWRRKGLGRALLLHGLLSLRSASMDTALLGVDSMSLTGANRLYESVGFRVRSREFQYECDLDEVAIGS